MKAFHKSQGIVFGTHEDTVLLIPKGCGAKKWVGFSP